MKKIVIALLAALMIGGTLTACGGGAETNTAGSVVNPQGSVLSEEQTYDVLHEVFGRVSHIVTKLSAALQYWEDTDFSTANDILDYEAQWRHLEECSEDIVDLLSTQKPNEEYEKEWYQVLGYAKQLAPVFEKLTNLDINGDGEYTGSEIAPALREMQADSVSYLKPMVTILSDFEEEYKDESDTVTKLLQNENGLLTNIKVNLIMIGDETDTNIDTQTGYEDGTQVTVVKIDDMITNTCIFTDREKPTILTMPRFERDTEAFAYGSFALIRTLSPSASADLQVEIIDETSKLALLNEGRVYSKTVGNIIYRAIYKDGTLLFYGEEA